MTFFNRSIPHQSKIVEGWTIPFLGSDKSIIRRSQRLFYEENKKRPVQIETYMTVPNIIHLIGFIIFGSIFGILARFSFGRALLLKVIFLVFYFTVSFDVFF